MSIVVRSFVFACVLSFLSSSNLFAMSLTSDENIDDIENFSNGQRSPKKQKVNDGKSQPSGSFKVNPHYKIKSFSQINTQKFLEPEGTSIVLFDLDRTLVCPKYAFHNFRPEEQNNILDEFYYRNYFDGTHDEFIGFIEYMKSTQYNYFSPNYIKDEKLVEESARTFINGLQKKGVLMLGLTARSFIIAKDTYNSLNDLGLDFNELSGGLKICNDSFRKKTNLNPKAGVENGIFYTGDQVFKVSLIPEIVNLVSEKLNVSGPFNVYHFDDSESEVGAYYDKTETEHLHEKSHHRIFVQPCFYTGHEKFLNSLRANINSVHQEIDEELIEKYLKLKNKKN